MAKRDHFFGSRRAVASGVATTNIGRGVHHGVWVEGDVAEAAKGSTWDENSLLLSLASLA